MKAALVPTLFFLLCGIGIATEVTERTRGGGKSRLTSVKTFVNRRIRQAVERRLDIGSLCDDFGSDFMDGDLKCKCNDSDDPNVIQIECSLEAECAYAGTICSDGGSVTFTMKGFDELTDLMKVDMSERQKSYDLEIIMTSCTNYVSPEVGRFCLVLPMTNTVYLTTEDLKKSLKIGDSCKVTLDGKDCVCEMDKEDDYAGDGEEPCFKTDCTAVDDSFFINICKVVVPSPPQDELQTSFLLPFRLIEKVDEPDVDDKPDDSNKVSFTSSDGDASPSWTVCTGIWYALALQGSIRFFW